VEEFDSSFVPMAAMAVLTAVQQANLLRGCITLSPAEQRAVPAPPAQDVLHIFSAAVTRLLGGVSFAALPVSVKPGYVLLRLLAWL